MDTILNSPTGKDSIKGGIFFGSNLTPTGSFSNIPETSQIEVDKNISTPDIVSTLGQLKEKLQAAGQQQTATSENLYSPETLNKFLTSYTQLLIDYEDIRNLVFFGSAYVELNYNINLLSNSFPFKSFISKDTTQGFLDITYEPGGVSKITFSQSEITFPGKLFFNNSGKTQWTQNYDIVDVNNTRFPIIEFKELGGGVFYFRVSGVVSLNNLIVYTPTDTEILKGLIISPKFIILNDFNATLTGVQKALLSVFNPTPWPREPITNNIITEGLDFELWIENPTNMVKSMDPEVGYVVTESDNLNLVGALTLDDFETNQILRRCIPPEIVNELNDTDERYFTRFVLLAGKMFDLIKVYIDFLQYTKTLNYKQYNQLSPEFYELYASHFGFSLLKEDDLDFAKSVIFTEPNLSYNSQTNYNSTTSEQTLKQLINEKHKRLLVSLFYLYQKKGTIESLQFLTSLLGSPEGLVLIEEYLYNANEKRLESNVDKVFVPNVVLEIDKSHLKNPENIYDPVNYPYVYKYKLDNENLINLREISVGFDAVGAITRDVLKYGTLKHYYGNFKPNFYANLQKENGEYSLLPLSFPDKFNGVVVDYNIPKIGFFKTINTENENSFNLLNLHKVDDLYYKLPVSNLTIDTNTLLGEITIKNSLGLTFPSYIVVEGCDEILISNFYLINNTVEQGEDLVISFFINLTDYAGGVYAGEGYLVHDKFNFNSEPYLVKKQYGYLIPVNCFSDGEIETNYKKHLNVKNAESLTKITGTVTNPNVSKITVKVKSNIGTGTTLVKNTFCLDTIEETVFNLVDIINQRQSSPDFFASYLKKDGVIYFKLEFNHYSSSINNQPYSVIFECEDDSVLFDGVSNNYENTFVSDYFQQTESEEYIVNRIEGKDLVLRIKLKNENTGDIVERVACFENLFKNDGLNHRLKLLYRPEGTEITLDYEYLGIALWRENQSIYSTLNVPKSIIKTSSVLSLPIDLFAYPDNDIQNNTGEDKVSWWDMFVGSGVLIEVNVSKLSIFEKLFISQQDVIDYGLSSQGDEIERWSFDFRNQKTDITSLPYKDRLDVVCSYRKPFPYATNSPLAEILANYYLNNFYLINLTNKSEFIFKVEVADFFNLKELDEKNIFKHNGWSKTLKTDYDYSFKEMYHNYEVFNPQLLTVLNLLPFISLVEKKFKPLVAQFIPLVINLSKFGKVIKNVVSKTRYSKAYFLCNGTREKSKAIASFKITGGTIPTNPGDIVQQLRIKIKTRKTDIVSVNNTAKTITFETVHNWNTGDFVKISLAGVVPPIGDEYPFPPFEGCFLIVKIDDYTIKIDVSLPFSGTYLNSGYVDRYDPGLTFYPYTWQNSNNYTIEKIHDHINGLGGVVEVLKDNNLLVLTIDPVDFQTTYNRDVNKEILELQYTYPYFIIENISSFKGGMLPITGNNCLKIEYIPIVPDKGAEVFYIYLENENSPELFIYEDEESSIEPGAVYI